MTTDRMHEEAVKVLAEAAEAIAVVRQVLPDVCRAAGMIRDCLHGGGRLLLFGNGGSAAQAQHLAAELVGRFEAERQPIPALALTTDTSAITSIANDYGYEEIFARQIRALARPGDLVMALSTSGNSPNVLRGLRQAQDMGLKTIGLTGRVGGKMRDRLDLCLCVAADSTARIQESHLVIAHILCRLIESSFPFENPHS